MNPDQSPIDAVTPRNATHRVKKRLAALAWITVGPGAWAIALACADGVVAFLSQGSIVTKIMLWVLEIALCVFVYTLVFPLLGGWG
jgi:hypothetical protein